MKLRLAGLSLLALLFTSSAAPPLFGQSLRPGRPPVRFRTLALSGMQAPGLPDGVTLQFFIDFSDNARGDVAFRAGLLGEGVNMDNDAANFVVSRTGMRLLARDGDQVNGLPQGTTHRGLCYFCSIGPIPGPRIDATGRTAFMTLFEGNGFFGHERSGLFVSTGGVPLTHLASGQQAPGNPGLAFVDIVGVPTLLPGGRVAFTSRLTDNAGSFGNALFAGLPTGLNLIAEEGQIVPPLGPNFTYQHFIVLPTREQQGPLTFVATMPENGAQITRGVLTADSGAVQVVFRQGDQALGQPSGVDLIFFYDPSINRLGRMAFQAFLQGTGIVAGTNNIAILSNRTGSWHTVAQIGDAPSCISPDLFSNLFRPVLNDSGQLAFVAHLNGPGGAQVGTDQALFLDDLSRRRLLARSGGPAPDLPSGVNYDQLHLISLSNPGRVVYSAVLEGNVDATNRVALYMTDRRARPRLLVRTGQPFELSPGDVRTVNSFVPASTGSELSFLARDGDELPLVLGFSDGSYALVAARVLDAQGRAFIAR